VLDVEAWSSGGVGIEVPRTLASKWPCATRLETRTKESNMCASLRVYKPSGGMKVKVRRWSS